ncbi:hypothetical protein [Yersinia phage MHG19]|nr:hypothetical protein [Yersinia phage MHG19]
MKALLDIDRGTEECDLLGWDRDRYASIMTPRGIEEYKLYNVKMITKQGVKRIGTQALERLPEFGWWSEGKMNIVSHREAAHRIKQSRKRHTRYEVTTDTYSKTFKTRKDMLLFVRENYVVGMNVCYKVSTLSCFSSTPILDIEERGMVIYVSRGRRAQPISNDTFKRYKML